MHFQRIVIFNHILDVYNILVPDLAARQRHSSAAPIVDLQDACILVRPQVFAWNANRQVGKTIAVQVAESQGLTKIIDFFHLFRVIQIILGNSWS